MKKICQNPHCGKEFEASNGRTKYCSKNCAEYMHDHKNDIEKYKDKPCECCGKDHDHTYGSGRFCSEECKIEYISSTKRGANNPKVKAHLDKLRAMGKIAQRAKYGRWTCKICNRIFETREQLRKHLIDSHHYHNNIVYDKENGFKCPYCEKTFDTIHQILGHMSNCKNHPNKKLHDESHKRGHKIYSDRCRSGKIVPWFKGKHHSEESRKKMRIAACNYLINNNATPCRYNHKSIPILESIAKEHGWNIQHAENGGEFYTGIGYWLDAYDKDLNVAIEYDERFHYDDVDNNILRQKDLERQSKIIEHLHCEFWRYNETTGVLWKVK